MSIKFIKYYFGILLLVLAIGSVILYRSIPSYDYNTLSEQNLNKKWVAPDTLLLSHSSKDELIRYGMQLITHTAAYLGPNGSVARISNGMNCQNCHLDGGTRLYGNSLALVATTYPRFRQRSGRVETIPFRINDCLKRSLNGSVLDTQSREMQAMVAYLQWMGKDVTENMNTEGTKTPTLPLLDRAADTAKGRSLFRLVCTRCHGENGAGQLMPDSIGYAYPPLWGEHSYNIGAGLYRLAQLASFIKYNMPYMPHPTPPQLSDSEAWDLAAFISAQPRPVVLFPGDWPVIKSKPFDYPFGPYADSFPQLQHKFGPFKPIVDYVKPGKKKLP